jgi:hypothetical protein
VADAHIQLPADSTGKSLATQTYTNGERSDVHVQELGLVDSAGNNVETASATLAGAARSAGSSRERRAWRASRVTSRR